MRHIIAALLFFAVAATAATEREVAEWVLRWEGSLILEGAPQNVSGGQPIRDVFQLPAGDFHIASIDLSAAVMRPVELRELEGLTHLRQLYLPGKIWNPGAGNEDKTGVFEALASLTSVERLAFSWHFNSNIEVVDKGIDKLAPWSGLKHSRCSQCRLAKPKLSVFSELRDLDLSDNPFTDEGMASLAGLRNLKHLILRNTLVTDDGLKYLQDLSALEELDLSGTRITGRGLEHLSNLKSIRRLNLLGAQVPDESMDVLAGMKSLEVLNLYRTLVTNSGLASLHSLKNLTDVDVRYSRVTANGVEALRAALPEVKVRFDGAGLLKTLRPGAANPANSSPQAIAKWVRLMGGSADLVDGRLTSVNLASTSLSDAQLAFLENLPDLHNLHLRATQLS